MAISIGLIIIIAVLVLASKTGVKRVSEDNGVIAGVCGGIAKKLDLAPNLVRVIAAVLALGSGGGIVMLYILMWIVLPREG